MKRQSYDGSPGINRFAAMVINTLVTYFKRTIGKTT